VSNRDLDLAALRLDARRNGGGPRSEREERLRWEERLKRDREAVLRDREALLREWRRVTVAWVLLVATTILLGAGWPTLLAWADLMWRR
jgi:hypothetical protein